MEMLCPEDLERLARLDAPTRNRYFYGKLLTERHFDLEQRYFNRKRWLLNRLTLGSGVICGLDVVPAADGKLRVTPGVAIDGFGREIVVPEPSRPFDPRVLTDECGQPTGERAKGPVTICLAYHECDVEPVPVRVTECETEQRCAPSLVRERYMVLVFEAGDPGKPIYCTHPHLFETAEPGRIHGDLVNRELKGCPPAGRTCVVLANVKLSAEAARIEPEAILPFVRSLVYPAPLLYELILCLSERVEQCCHALTLRYVSGDAQEGPLNQILKNELVVQVVNAAGQAVRNEKVTFRVQGGAGSLPDANGPNGEQVVQSGAGGTAAARWKLGPKARLQTATAALDNGASIGFHALAVGEAAKPPRITRVWPGNGLSINASNPQNDDDRDWSKPHLELAFDQPMTTAQIEGPDSWLRLYRFKFDHGVQITCLQLAFQRPSASAATPTARYAVLVGNVGETKNARYLVAVRAENANITARAGSHLLLDADFTGTRLDVVSELTPLWDRLAPGQSMPATGTWANLAAIGTLSSTGSGDGSPGGWFHSMFAVSD